MKKMKNKFRVNLVEILIFVIPFALGFYLDELIAFVL